MASNTTGKDPLIGCAGVLAGLLAVVLFSAGEILLLGGLAFGLGFKVERWDWVIGGLAIGIPLKWLGFLSSSVARKCMFGDKE